MYFAGQDSILEMSKNVADKKMKGVVSEMSGTRFRNIVPKIKSLDSESIHSVIQHLAKEHGFFENVFDTIGEGVIVVNTERRILYSNKAAKTILGMPEDISRLTVDRLLKGANWDEILPVAGCAGTSKLMRQELEIFYPERRVIRIYAMPLGGNSVEPHYAVILNDITATIDRAHSEAETERGKLISMLAAGVAHEIGNPLNSLYLHLQYLQRLVGREEFDRESATEELQESRKEVERLDAIINQFLKALRPGKPEMRLLDLKELVLESLKFMQHEITQREVKVEFTWSDDIPAVDGDSGQLKQAFYNLTRNALQAMPTGGQLQIRCTSSDEFVSLSVTDSGNGIKAEDLSHLFDAYFTTKRTGTGLGLMIVERIVREHGGSLSVDSSEGHGATFTISLPRRDRKLRVLSAGRTDDDARKDGVSCQ